MTEPPPTVPEEFRPGLRLAANLLLDDILHCLVEGRPDESLAVNELPPNFRLHIEKDLYRWSVAFTIAGAKLCGRVPIPPASVAESLAMWAVLQFAVGILQDGTEFGLPARVPEDETLAWRDQILYALCEDTDFLMLYTAVLDGIGADPDEPIGKYMGTVNLAYADWFRAFEECEGHPYFDEGKGMEAEDDDCPWF